MRRAKYYAKLGYSPHRLVLPLRSLLPLGGAVPCLRILVSTVYPLIVSNMFSLSRNACVVGVIFDSISLLIGFLSNNEDEM